MNTSRNQNIITGVTFAFFMAEAIIHYNIGVKSIEPEHKFSVPPTKDLFKLGITVAIFSITSGMVANYLIKA